ncbi:MAG: class I SAM-dependent methyltransferase [Acidimicrobiia bacterium]
MGSDWSGEAYAAAAGHHRSFDDWFLDRLPPEEGDTVLDLGCGSGEFTARLADIVTKGKVIGVEPDVSMLEAARRHDNPRLEFVRGSAEDFDELVEPGSIDKVVSRAMLHWVPLKSYPRVFAAVFRVLRPGGWYHSESAGAGNVPKVMTVVRDLASRFGVPAPPPFPDTGVVFDLVEEAGFELPVEAVKTIAQRRPFTREQMIDFLRTQAAVVVTRAADQDIAASTEDAAAGEVEALRRHDGSFDQTFVRLEILARHPV